MVTPMAKLKQCKLNRKVNHITGHDEGYSVIDSAELAWPRVSFLIEHEDGLTELSSEQLSLKHAHLAARFIILLKNEKHWAQKSILGCFVNSKPFFKFLDQRVEPPATLKIIKKTLAKQFENFLRTTYPKAADSTQRSRYKNFMWFYRAASVYLDNEVADDVVNGKMPRNPFKGEHRTAQSAPAYSEAEKKIIMPALQAAYKDSHNRRDAYALSVRVALLLSKTGFNVSSILTLSRDPLVPHPFDPKREILIGIKPRARHSVKQILDKPSKEIAREQGAVGKNASLLIREILATNEVLSQGGYGIDALAIYRTSDGEIRRLSNTTLNANLLKVSKDFGLQIGTKILRISGARLRATFSNKVYRMSGSFITTAKLLNHSSSINLAANTYIHHTKQDERQFSFVGKVFEQKMRGKNSEIIQSVDLSEDPPAPEALSTAVAKCSDPVNGTYAPKNGQTCINVLECFFCEQMTVFRNDLHRLLSFYYAIKNEKARISIAVWTKRFFPILQIIDSEILPQFQKSYVDEARTNAIKSPHPMWAQPGVFDEA
jgi:hypothetical protein